MSKQPDFFTVRTNPSVLCILGLLALALTGRTFGATQFGKITDTAAPELPAIGITTGASGVIHVEMAAPVRAGGQKSFAFGYLEFDWDPNAPGGMPGFDSWPG